MLVAPLTNPPYIVFTKTDKGWQIAGHLNMEYQLGPKSLEELEAQLTKGDYAVADSQWQDLRVGKITRRFRADN